MAAPLCHWLALLLAAAGGDTKAWLAASNAGFVAVLPQYPGFLELTVQCTCVVSSTSLSLGNCLTLGWGHEPTV